jgi:undecaprenyl-diphosphatase
LKADVLPIWCVSLASFAACFVLGWYVRGRPPTGFDLAGERWRGSGTRVAAVFTTLGRWYAVVGLAAIVALSASFCGTGPLPILTLLASQILAQGAVGLLKRVIRRARPDYWLLRRERDLSYPSGHSATAIVFFVPLVSLTVAAHIVPDIVAPPVACAFALCVFGIPWSRLALGAHYPTDVLGGLLFGGGWLAASVAILASR